MLKAKLLHSIIPISFAIVAFTLVLYGIGFKPDRGAVKGLESPYECRSQANTPYNRPLGFYTDIFASRLAKNTSYLEDDENIPTKLSLSDYENDYKNLERDIYFKAEKSNEAIFGKVMVALQLCNEDNKSYTKIVEEPTEDQLSYDVVSVYTAIHDGYVPKVPGIYRIDAYVWFDGAWHLTDKLQGIEFVE